MWKKKLFIKALEISVSFSSFIGVILSFIVFPTGYWWIGLISFIGVFLVSFFTSYLVLRNLKHHRISRRGPIFIESMYGNIMEIKKRSNSGEKPVVVIPVNTSFDTIVEDDLNIKDRIVEGSTIHGQWLNKYAPDELSLKNLQKEIKASIKNSGLILKHTLNNKRGNKEIYELGSSIFIEKENCSFLLFALTEFDEHNKVIKKDPECFVELMSKLMNATDKCPGKHVYIPVMGTKIALFGLNTLQAFEYIKNAAQNKKNSLRASITIVIYDGNRDEVSIYD